MFITLFEIIEREIWERRAPWNNEAFLKPDFETSCSKEPIRTSYHYRSTVSRLNVSVKIQWIRFTCLKSMPLSVKKKKKKHELQKL